MPVSDWYWHFRFTMGKRTVEQPRAVSHETLYGWIILFAMGLFVAAVVAAVGSFIYAKWHSEKQEDDLPSIMALSSESDDENNSVSRESDQEDISSDEDTSSASMANTAVTDPKTVEVTVLNGGAASGSAGTVVTLLKGAGYQKAAAENASGTYSGVTIYYRSGFDTVAAAVQEALKKKYPSATVAAAGANNQETSKSTVTVVLGK